MLAAFLQARQFTRGVVDFARSPNLGMLLVEFFNFYISMKFQAVDIKPSPPDQPIESFPVAQKSTSEYMWMQITDPLNAKNNVAKSSYNFFQLENLFYFIFFATHQGGKESTLANIFETAKLFNLLSQPAKKSPLT